MAHIDEIEEICESGQCSDCDEIRQEIELERKLDAWRDYQAEMAEIRQMQYDRKW